MEAIILPKKIEFNKILLNLKSPVINIALISIGSLVFIVGMNGILAPNKILNGGIVGIAMLMHYLFPFMGIGAAYFLLNIPLAIIGWRNISRRFMVYSLFGMLFFSLAAAMLHPKPPEIEDPMLIAIFGGVICGLGAGLILRSIGSAGGLDILAIYLNKKFGFRIGSIIFTFNALVLLTGAYLYDVEMILYSIVYLYSSSKTMDMVLTGFNRRKSLIVISDQAEEIADSILSDKGRGVTFLRGEGAFSRKEKKVIFTITSLTELTKMKELIWRMDPDAFMVINDTLEVLGKRHGRGRVY